MTVIATSPKARRTHPRRHTAGFITVAVLWILGAFAALLSVYTLYVTNTAAAFGVHDARVRAQALVSAAVELTAYRLTASPPPSPSSPPVPTSGNFNFRMGHANVTVEFRSEAARIDLNAAPAELLAGLFVALGAVPDAAAGYADRIVEWRGSNPNGQGSEDFSYHAAGLGYAPRGGRFPNVHELALVRDLPAALVERALPFVTVYNGRSQVNVLEAAPEVIAALPGMTPDRLNAFLAQRQATPDDRQVLMSLLGASKAYATAQGNRASRVRVHVAFDSGDRADSEAVILTFEEGAEPYSVLSWHDDLDDHRPATWLKASAR